MADKTKFTPGPWRVGKDGGSIVADSPVGGHEQDEQTTEYYGGQVICETVSDCNKPLIAAAPKLLEECKLCRDIFLKLSQIFAENSRFLEIVIAKAEGK